MLDPMVCVSMKLGEPRVAVAALRELHHLLVEGGLRGTSFTIPLSFRRSATNPTSKIIRQPASGVANSPTSEQLGVHFSPALGDECIAESASLGLSRQPANAGRRLRNSGGQR